VSAVKVILRDDVSGLGKRGDIVEVSKGYVRNFLEPRGLAMAATEGAQQQAESMRRSRDIKARGRSPAAIATVLVRRPSPSPCASEAGLFGSVSETEIVDAVRRHRHRLDRKDLLLGAHQDLGTHGDRPAPCGRAFRSRSRSWRTDRPHTERAADAVVEPVLGGGVRHSRCVEHAGRRGVPPLVHSCAQLRRVRPQRSPPQLQGLFPFLSTGTPGEDARRCPSPTTEVTLLACESLPTASTRRSPCSARCC
jgi:large subunit ribosomal protein L9